MFRKKAPIAMMISILLTACGLVEQDQPQVQPPERSRPLSMFDLEHLDNHPQVAEAIIDFSNTLLNHVMREDAINPVLSPLSVYYALSMTALGSRTSTYEAFQQVLGLSPQRHSRELYLLGRHLTAGSGEETITMANSVWIHDWFEIHPEVAEVVTAHFGGSLYTEDLRVAAAITRINDWVERQTHGLIPAMLEELSPEVAMVLVNTLYFQGLWDTIFPLDEGVNAFATTAGDTIQTPFLSQRAMWWQSAVTETYQAVVLPYRGGHVGMLLVMSTDGTSVRAFPYTFDEVKLAMDQHMVDVHFPAWEVSFDLALNEALEDMGLGVAFDEDHADLWDLFTEESRAGFDPPYITQVLHEVKIIVNRYGTEAAAATVADVAMPSSAWMIQYELMFDQPFMYVIYQVGTNIPLFMGMIDDPSI